MTRQSEAFAAGRFRGARRWARAAAGVVSIAAAGLLAACGGGDQVSKFVPARLLSFGDENSVITANGRNYGINGVNAGKTAVDCNVQKIWNQILANSYSLYFPECPNGAAVASSRILAQPGAKVSDMKGQIDQFLAASEGRLNSNDLVSLLAGPNDLWAQYALYNGSNEPALIAAMEAAGTAYAAQANRLADAGGRVVISTMPDQSLTPYALAQKAAFADTDRAALVKRLMTAFHTKLRVTLLNDGRRIGLVLADELAQQIVQYPASYEYSNINTSACAVALPDCTTETLVPGAGATSWLWADGTHFSAGGHARLGEAARVRATGNPF